MPLRSLPLTMLPLLLLVHCSAQTVTELSNPSNSGQTLRLSLWAGTSVVLMVEGRAPEPVAPPDCNVEPLDAIAPHPADGTGPWLLRLTPQSPGAQTVTLEAGLTVELAVYPRPSEHELILASDVGLGCYTDWATYGAQWEPQVFDLLRRFGCNTLTVYGHGGADGSDVARQLDAALDLGLIDTRFPVLLVPSVSREDDLLALSLDMRAKGNKAHGTRRLPIADEYPKHRWPALVACGLDHPTKSNREQALWVAEANRRGLGLKTASTIAPGEFDALRDALGVAIIDCQELDRDTCQTIRKCADCWAYSGSLQPEDAALARYYAGVWAFAIRPQVALVWSSAQLLTIGPNGPQATPALEGLREGRLDYQALRNLERLARTTHGADAEQAVLWLQSLCAGPWSADVDPPDCGEIRATTLAYTAKLKQG